MTAPEQYRVPSYFALQLFLLGAPEFQRPLKREERLRPIIGLLPPTGVMGSNRSGPALGYDRSDSPDQDLVPLVMRS
jgi:hypothetical protein